MRSKRLVPYVSVVAIGLFAAGCSKKQEIAVAPPTTTEPAAQVPVPAARAAAEANFQVKDLELQVDAYQKIYKRKPGSLEQMVQEGFLSSLPPAPPGKRYHLDPATLRVSLVP